ncbi:MAG: hypothetical protein ACI4ST_00465 [Candidatus Gallimonas sp.]
MKTKSRKMVAIPAVCLFAAGLTVSLFASGAFYGVSASGTDGQAFTMNYFTAQNAELNVDDQGLLVETNAEGGSVTFDKALPVDFIGASFQALSGKTNFNGVEFTLTDTKDAEQSVILSFTKSVRNDDYTVVRINGSGERKVAVSLNESGSQYFSFSYSKAEESFVTYSDGALGKVENYSNGDDFEGFSSGAVNFSVRFTGVTGESGIRILDVANQPLSQYVTADRQGPMLLLSRQLPLMLVKEQGETLIVPSVTVYDFFNDVQSTKVTVKYNDDIVYEGDATSEQEISLSQKGTCYVEYTVYDTVGNKTQKICTVMAKDTQAPEITLNKTTDKATVGKVYTLQKANVTSDNSVELFVYIMNENGGRISVQNGTYTFKEEGKYTVCYYAVDVYQNIAIKTYTVEVTK